MDHPGRFVEVYQQSKLSGDESWLTDKLLAPAYSIDHSVAVSRWQLEDAIHVYHTVYHPHFHPAGLRGRASFHNWPWLSAILWYCEAPRVPCVAGEAWVAFNDARRRLRLRDLAYDRGSERLTFAIQAEQAIVGATLVFSPAFQGSRALPRATIDGEPVAATVKELEGQPQATIVTDFAAGQTCRVMVRT